MPIVRGSEVPTFILSHPDTDPPPSVPHLTVRGYASPTTGAKETAVYVSTFAPATPPRPGYMDHEEIYIILAGNAIVTMDGEENRVQTGDCIIVPQGVVHGISNPYNEPLKFVAIVPVGAQAFAAGQEPFVPIWAQ